MRWLRSWPAQVPTGRAHVVDQLPRLVISGYDYGALASVDDDVLLLEWDMACSIEDQATFEDHAAAEPARVQVAPYRLYTDRPDPVWAHRVLTGDGPKDEAWITEGRTECDLPGFGMIYLPRAVVAAFLAAPASARGRDPRLDPGRSSADARFTCQTFGIWHAFRWDGPPIRVWWDIRPIHLHT